ncbi:hypothetical protein SAMN05216262_11122 [Colwellia chukchiensis]|uniref:SatD family (SatD) n=2 Tax=Colwellia chukchiensis TaxID=641665 RepID=A0A1H7Q9K1_9GAMM|nr:hypothetical protein SAMN05216262_11122 [Colwellia chukchiensis]
MIAVLTGDLVNSTKMSKQTYASTIKALQDLLAEAAQAYRASGAVYRGDEFQIQYPEPIFALKSTLLIKLALHLSSNSSKPIQCTLSLAYGDYNHLDEKPNTSSGPVFIRSGRGLTSAQRGELAVHFPTTIAEQQTRLLSQFLNHLLNRLTKSQAQLLYQYIASDFAEHKKLAQITATTRQNISNRLANIGAFLVRDYMKFINQKVLQLTET